MIGSDPLKIRMQMLEKRSGEGSGEAQNGLNALENGLAVSPYTLRTGSVFGNMLSSRHELQKKFEL